MKKPKAKKKHNQTKSKSKRGPLFAVATTCYMHDLGSTPMLPCSTAPGLSAWDAARGRSSGSPATCSPVLHASEWMMTDEMTEGARPFFAASRPKKQQTKRGCSAGIQVSHLDGQRVQVLMQVLGSRVLVSWRNPGVRSNGGCSYSLATQRNTTRPTQNS